MQRSFPRPFLLMLAGPIIWAGHYLFIYAVNGVACARPALHAAWAGVPVSSWIIIAASVAALVAMGLIYLRLRTRMPQLADPGFLPWLAGALSLLSAVAVVWETIPALLVPACG
jgi:hypothetical protein